MHSKLIGKNVSNPAEMVSSVGTGTGGSCLSQIFWEHENQSSLLVIWLIYIKLYRKRKPNFGKKIQAKRESGLTAVRLKRDPPVCNFTFS